MLTVVIVLIVCMILGIAYVFFGKEQKNKKKKELEQSQLTRDFFRQELANIEKLELAGVGTDGNSDFEFIQAVGKIELQNNIRVKIYD